MYDPSGLATTVTRPGGATETTTRFLDGRVRSVTGSGVIPRYNEYGVNADGFKWTRVNSTDRITDSDSSFILIADDWWRQTSQAVYATKNDDTPHHRRLSADTTQRTWR